VLVPEARRLHLAVLVHMPLGHRPMATPATPGRVSARPWVPPAPSSPPAPGRVDVCSSSTRCPRTASTSPGPASMLRRRRAAARPAGPCSAWRR
jgi:hypothetical protein